MNKKQKDLWEKIFIKYKEHYFDYWSVKYKKRFIFDKLTSMYNFANKDALELCCGSGENSSYIVHSYPGVNIVGMDISKRAVEDFESHLNMKCYEADIQQQITSLDKKFDVIFVLGGIHHCTKNIEGVFSNISRMLRPGGCFIMHEPNSRFFLESLRQFWYRRDPMFDVESEHALDHDQLLVQGSKYGFELEKLEYIGGPGFFVILQSMILRIPKSLKKYISPVFYVVEILWDLQKFPLMNNTFMSCWVKKG